VALKMKTRQEFCQRLAKLELDHQGRAIALLWYYRQSGEFEERSASELANDLHDEGFPKPNTTRLHKALQRSPFTIRGKRQDTFQIDLRREDELNDQYSKLVNIRTIKVSNTIIPSEWVQGTRSYLERMVWEINGSYEIGFYDACAVLCRRMMESLIVEIYIHQGREAEIKHNNQFLVLENLIGRVQADPKITLSRGVPKTMADIKGLGDTAAHNRVYITNQVDIDDLKSKFRAMIKELLVQSGITT
jgi:hypothetical protein